VSYPILYQPPDTPSARVALRPSVELGMDSRAALHLFKERRSLSP
jgi:hypothetical protein